MNERKKIIIQTGANEDESLPTPHFDVEATLTARPVVPLSEQDAFQKQAGGYGTGAVKPFWRRPALLALIVLVAAGVGVAAGLAIGFYKQRNAAPAPVVNVPSATEENANVSQPVEQPTLTRQARASLPSSTEETAPAEPKTEERERTDERASSDRARRNEQKRDDDDDEVTPPPVVRDKKRDKNDDDDERVVFDEKQVERQRRRDERRERRRQRNEEQAVDIPRRIERVEQGVNRIREIFEGKQP